MDFAPIPITSISSHFRAWIQATLVLAGLYFILEGVPEFVNRFAIMPTYYAKVAVLTFIAVIALFFMLIFRPFSQPYHLHTRSFLSLSLLSTLFLCYCSAIQPTILINSYDLTTIPFILFFFHSLSFDELRT